MGLIAHRRAGDAPPPAARGRRRPRRPETRPRRTAGAPAATRVEVVRPERRTIRRTTEQPGQIEAFETTPIHARVAGYVRKWNVDIGAKVKKGQVLAVLSVPELDAEAEQKQAAGRGGRGQARPGRAAEEVAQASLVGVQAKLVEVQAGIKRAEADLARWQAESARVEQLFQRAGPDRQPARRDPEQARGRPRPPARRSGPRSRRPRRRVRQCPGDARQGPRRRRPPPPPASRSPESDARRVQALRAYATIVAPYDGVITARNVDVGDLTQPGPQGQPLFTWPGTISCGSS